MGNVEVKEAMLAKKDAHKAICKNGIQPNENR